MPTSSPSSNYSTDDETEFVKTEDTIPIVKTRANLKGRLAGLAKGRELVAAKRNAVKKVKEVTQTINKAQRLQEKATTILNEGRVKAKEAGVEIPEASPYESQLQDILNEMRNEIKGLKTVVETKKSIEVAPVPEPVQLPEPVVEAPKKRAAPRKKPAPKPKPEPEPEPEPQNEKIIQTYALPVAKSPLDAYRYRGQGYSQQKDYDDNARLEHLRLLMGRK